MSDLDVILVHGGEAIEPDPNSRDGLVYPRTDFASSRWRALQKTGNPALLVFSGSVIGQDGLTEAERMANRAIDLGVDSSVVDCIGGMDTVGHWVELGYKMKTSGLRIISLSSPWHSKRSMIGRWVLGDVNIRTQDTRERQTYASQIKSMGMRIGVTATLALDRQIFDLHPGDLNAWNAYLHERVPLYSKNGVAKPSAYNLGLRMIRKKQW